MFQSLKRQPVGNVIELDSPSPPKRSRATFSPVRPVSVPNPETLPGMDVYEEDGMPTVGEADDIEAALEEIMDQEHSD